MARGSGDDGQLCIFFGDERDKQFRGGTVER